MKGSTANKYFQIEYSILKRFVPRKIGSGLLLSDYSARFGVQLSGAMSYGPVGLAIMGDSNGENLSSRENMTQLGDGLDAICTNFAIGGRTAEDWIEFFTRSAAGRAMYLRLYQNPGIKFLWNIGGNNVLQYKMATIKESLQVLKQLFPSAYFCTIPAIHVSMLVPTGFWTAFYLAESIIKVNDYIREIAGERCIDLFALTKDYTTGEAYMFWSPNGFKSVLEDPIHFSDDFDQTVRIPIIVNRLKVN